MTEERRAEARRQSRSSAPLSGMKCELDRYASASEIFVLVSARSGGDLETNFGE